MTESIQGTFINYRMTGEGDSRVVLLHGWGCDLTMMQPVADALKNEHRVLQIDFPGHGKSGRPPEPWGVPEYAECLKGLLKRLDFLPCAVVAHSFGCRVAAWLEADDPFLFTKLIFTGAAGIRPRPSETVSRRQRQYQQLKKLCGHVKGIPGLRHFAEGFEERIRQKYGSRDYVALDPEMRKTFVKVINLDLSGVYARFRASTLLVWGDKDTETPLWMGREMEKLIPDAGLVILEGGSHFAYLEQAARFNTIARHFLKEDA